MLATIVAAFATDPCWTYLLGADYPRLAPLFARPDIKAPVLALLPFGARVLGAMDGNFFAVAGCTCERLLPPAPGGWQ